MEPEPRGIKRTRQACQNCRRKKTRCGGERPGCSFCLHLGQQCLYDPYPSYASGLPDGHGAAMSQEDRSALLTRISTLELKLREIGLTRGDATEHSGVYSDSNADPSVRRRDTGVLELDKIAPAPPKLTQLKSINVYFQRCHGQPYSYFDESHFRRRFDDGELPLYLILAVMTLAGRFLPESHASPDALASTRYMGYAKHALSIIMQDSMISGGRVQLPVVQAVNLLAVAYFTEGETSQGWILIGLAIRMAQELNLTSEPDESLGSVDREEYRRTFWSVYLLDKLVSCSRNRPSVFQDRDCSTHLPRSEITVPSSACEPTPTLDEIFAVSRTPPRRMGSFALAVAAASTLGKATHYMLQDRDSKSLPPWNSASEHILTTSALFELETMLSQNRADTSHSRLHPREGDSFEKQCRGHMVFSQMVFHLSHCLLGHPFLLRQLLAGLERTAPASFLREAFARSRSHAVSIVQLMADARVRGIRMDASFYGYCLCISGTIHILYLNDASVAVRSDSARQLQSILEYMDDLTDKWKHIPPMIHALKIAMDKAHSIPLDLTDPMSTEPPAHFRRPPSDLWWHIVDYSSLANAGSPERTPSLSPESASAPEPLQSQVGPTGCTASSLSDAYLHITTPSIVHGSDRLEIRRPQDLLPAPADLSPFCTSRQFDQDVFAIDDGGLDFENISYNWPDS